MIRRLFTKKKSSKELGTGPGVGSGQESADKTAATDRRPWQISEAAEPADEPGAAEGGGDAEGAEGAVGGAGTVEGGEAAAPPKEQPTNSGPGAGSPPSSPGGSSNDLEARAVAAGSALSPASLRALADDPAPSASLQLVVKAVMVALSEKPVLVRNKDTGERTASFWAAWGQAMGEDAEGLLLRVRALPRGQLPAPVVRRVGTILLDPACDARVQSDAAGPEADLARFTVALYQQQRALVSVGDDSVALASLDAESPAPAGAAGPAAPGPAAPPLRLDWSVLDGLEGPPKGAVEAGMEALQDFSEEEFTVLLELAEPGPAVTQVLEAAAAVTDRGAMAEYLTAREALGRAFSGTLPGKAVRAVRQLAGTVSDTDVVAEGGSAGGKLLAIVRGIWRLHDSGPAPTSPAGRGARASGLRGPRSPATPASAARTASSGASGRTPGTSYGTPLAAATPVSAFGRRAGALTPVGPRKSPEPEADPLLAAIRELRQIRKPSLESEGGLVALAEVLCEALALEPARQQDIKTGKVARDFWAPVHSLAKEPYRLRERLGALLEQPLEAARHKRFRGGMSRLDLEEVKRASVAASVVAQHLVRVRDAQGAMDHPSVESPQRGVAAGRAALPARHEEALARLEGPVREAVEVGMRALLSLTAADVTHLRNMAHPPQAVQRILQAAVAATGLVERGAESADWIAVRNELRDFPRVHGALSDALAAPLPADRLRGLVPHVVDGGLPGGGGKAGPEADKVHAVVSSVWELNRALQGDAVGEAEEAFRRDRERQAAPPRAKPAPAPAWAQQGGPKDLAAAAWEVDESTAFRVELLGVNVSAVTELRAMVSPPPGLVPVVHAVALLLGQEPVMRVAKNPGPKGKRHEPDWWKTALQMMHPAKNFVARLQDLADVAVNGYAASREDTAMPSPQQVREARTIAQSPQLEVECVRKQGICAGGLAVYVHRVSAALAPPEEREQTPKKSRARMASNLSAITEGHPLHQGAGEGPGYLRPTRSSSIRGPNPAPADAPALTKSPSGKSSTPIEPGREPRFMLATQSSKKKVVVDLTEDKEDMHASHFQGQLRSSRPRQQSATRSRDFETDSQMSGSAAVAKRYMTPTKSFQQRTSLDQRTMASQKTPRSRLDSEMSGTSLASGYSHVSAGGTRYRSKEISGAERPAFMRTTSSRAGKVNSSPEQKRPVVKKMHRIEFVSRDEVVELRTLRSPDKAVLLVVKAVALLMGIKPVRRLDVYKRRMEEDFWAPMVRAMLKGDEFLDHMRQCREERPRLPAAKWRTVKEIVTSPFFDPEVLGKCCKSAKGMSCWVLDVWERGVGVKGHDDDNEAGGVLQSVRKTIFSLAAMVTPRSLKKARDHAKGQVPADGTSQANGGGGDLEAHPVSPGVSDLTGVTGPGDVSVDFPGGQGGDRSAAASPDKMEVSFRGNA